MTGTVATASRYYRSHSRGGFLLLDALLGIVVFAFFVGIAGFSLLLSQRIAIRSGDRVRAAMLAREAVEAVRTLRDADFENVVEGQFGLQIGEEGMWEFSGTGSVTEDGFVTAINITELDEDRFEVAATTNWSIGPYRSGDITVTTRLTNWHQVNAIGNWASLSLEGSYIDASNPLFNNVAVSGQYAFVTSEVTSGGAGLYVFDISNLAVPVRKVDTFVLGVAAYQLVVTGDVLYVLTADDASELRAYDISSPETLSQDNLLGTYNLPGSGKGKALALYGDTLFVGAAEDAIQHEFYALDVSNPEGVEFLGSLNDEGGYLDLALHQGYAYVGSSKDVGELTVVDVFDPQDLSVMECSGCNLTDTPDGQAVGAFGEYVILGRSEGDVIQELVLFSVAESPTPSPPPQPKYYGTDASIYSLAWDPTGMYVFIATDDSNQELQVIDVERFWNDQLPRIAQADTETGDGRGVTYDPLRDRVFMTTNSALLIYKPGS